MKSLREGDIERMIGNSRNAEHANVVFVEGDIWGFWIRHRHKTRELRNLKWIDAKAGHEISMIRDGDLIVIIG